MPRRRDRHDRGLRGPLALPNQFTKKPVLNRGMNRQSRFAKAIEQALEQIIENCPQALNRVVVGFEDVPTKFVSWDNRVPLAAARSATAEHPGQIVLYRRPIEHRSDSNSSLKLLVKTTIVEQLNAITGFTIQELDPNSEE